VPLHDPAAPDAHRPAAFAEGGHHPDEKHCFEPLIEKGIYFEKTHLPLHDPLVFSKAAAVRTERHKYIYCPGEFDELYDLRDDPGERRNRAAEPGKRDIVAALRQTLLQWYLDTGDTVPKAGDPRGFARQAPANATKARNA
jgi:hypothetical protein